MSNQPTCGLEGKLPKHMQSQPDRDLCYDARECHYKIKIEYFDFDRRNICLYARLMANQHNNKEVKE